MKFRVVMYTFWVGGGFCIVPMSHEAVADHTPRIQDIR
jgi:hypothetical protein